ncbi:MAG TPA: ABC transporter ATP-binding protein [Phycisphaerales bacterium]|nr:ABC transporter ATP-binding protein [Phycisphaerales bacterium]
MTATVFAPDVLATKTGEDFAVDLSHVSKTYKGRVHALRGVEMRVRRGEVFGLLGPNGAGKSTLVKILLTVIRPSRADGTVLGRPVGHKPTLARVGYLPEHHRFPDYLTGAQVVDFYGALAQTPRAERRRRSGELLDLVGMTAWADKKVKGYSKGMRQRVGIAQALINNPDLVVLDEPTDGVDPVGRRDIRNVVMRLREQGRTVFLNSHLLSELEMVCDRVGIMVQGKVATQGTIRELTEPRTYYEVSLELEPRAARAAFGEVLLLGAKGEGGEVVNGNDESRRAILPWTRGQQHPVACTLHGSDLRIETMSAEVVQPVIDAARARGLVIRQVRLAKPSLEDLFMEAVTDPTTGEALPPGASREGEARP